MSANVVIDLSKRLIQAGVAYPNEIKGCSRAQIDEVRSVAKQKLPQIYEMFLSTMGCGAGRFFEGTDIFYPDILANRETAEELLKEDESSFSLSETDFVFACHQGYQFMYIPLSELEPDPPVFYYMEGMGYPMKKWDHFSDFLLKAVEDHERLPPL